MSQSTIRIRLESDDLDALNSVISQIKSMAQTLGLKINGPVPLPTKKLQVTVRRTPCGDGSETYERWEKRVSRRIIELTGSNKAIRMVLRVRIPNNVYVKIILKEGEIAS